MKISIQEVLGEVDVELNSVDNIDEILEENTYGYRMSCAMLRYEEAEYRRLEAIEDMKNLLLEMEGIR